MHRWGEGINSFVHLFNKRLLHTSYVPGSVLGASEVKAVNKNKLCSQKTSIVAEVENNTKYVKSWW